MNPIALNDSVNGILGITEQMRAAAEGDDWDKAIELQAILDTELHNFFSQPIAEPDSGLVRDMIEKLMESEQQLLQSALNAKATIHTASKKMSNELAALAAYAHSIE